MSDLSGKFTSFEEQSSAQHTELMEALNTIAFALGAPPTIPSTTLADISTQLTALIDGTALIYAANTTFYASMLSLAETISNNTDIIITNNSLNAQREIAAIYATFCDCATDAPLLEPPVDVTPTSLADEAKCRRIQFYLSVFGNWLNKIANYGASGAAITSTTLATLLASVTAAAGIVAEGVEVGAIAGPPGMIAAAVVSLIAIAVFTYGGSILIDYANQFNDVTLRDNMLQAMFAATTAEEGHSAFKTTLLAGMDAIPAEVIYTLWWTAWSNDIYSGTPEVDDSAFDGTICGEGEEVGECTEYPFTMRADHFGIVIWGDKYVPGDVNDPWTVGNFEGWRVTLVATSHVAEVVVGVIGDPPAADGNIIIFNAVGQSVVVDRPTLRMAIFTRYDNTIISGTVELCPPGTF